VIVLFPLICLNRRVIRLSPFDHNPPLISLKPSWYSSPFLSLLTDINNICSLYTKTFVLLFGTFMLVIVFVLRLDHHRTFFYFNISLSVNCFRCLCSVKFWLYAAVVWAKCQCQWGHDFLHHWSRQYKQRILFGFNLVRKKISFHRHAEAPGGKRRLISHSPTCGLWRSVWACVWTGLSSC